MRTILIAVALLVVVSGAYLYGNVEGLKGNSTMLLADAEASGAAEDYSRTGVAPDRDVYFPGTEELAADEMRVIACGSGMPMPRLKQAAACMLIELGNGDKFIFDMGAGLTLSVYRLLHFHINVGIHVLSNGQRHVLSLIALALNLDIIYAQELAGSMKHVNPAARLAEALYGSSQLNGLHGGDGANVTAKQDRGQDGVFRQGGDGFDGDFWKRGPPRDMDACFNAAASVNGCEVQDRIHGRGPIHMDAAVG
jgi:hypothetical protein